MKTLAALLADPETRKNPNSPAGPSVHSRWNPDPLPLPKALEARVADPPAVKKPESSRLGVASPPPQPPSGESILENVWWSLRFRAWAWQRRWGSASGDIELFVIYYDTATSQSLRHSVGLRGGLIGIINAFAERSYRGSNQVVIIHELLHTLGATDKYGPGNMPLYPEGYAEPYRQPLLPQSKAEIMGGRIPLTASQSRMPVSLTEVTIGVVTAAEIHWTGN